MAEPTAFEQYMLELINRARMNPQAEANRYQGQQFWDWTNQTYVTYTGNLNEGLPAGTISSTAKQPLAFDLNLIDQSRNHSDIVIRNGQVGHYEDGVWENVGAHIESSTTATGIAKMHADLFVDAGQHTGYVRGHRQNLMANDASQIGIGIRNGQMSFGTASIATQRLKFGSGNAFLTGVVYTDQVTDDNFYTVGEGLGSVGIQIVGSNGQTHHVSTMQAGGYQIQLAPDTYQVTFTGDFNNDGQSDSVTRSVSIGQSNVKLDFATDTFSAGNTGTQTGTQNGTQTGTQNGTQNGTQTGTQTNTQTGTDGDDSLWGGNGNDVLVGGAGADNLIGRGGADRLTGGTGADRFIFTSLSEGVDQITDFNGAEGDRIVLVGSNFIQNLGERLTFDSSTGVLSMDNTPLVSLGSGVSYWVSVVSSFSALGISAPASM